MYNIFAANYNAHGNAYSFLLTYSRIFWRLQSLSGHVVYTNVDGDLRWMTTFDATSNQGSAALYGVAHFGIDTIDDDARRDAYIEALVDLFQSEDARHFIDYRLLMLPYHILFCLLPVKINGVTIHLHADQSVYSVSIINCQLTMSIC